TRNFGQNRKSERVPSRQQLILRNHLAVFDQNVRAINDLIARDFAAALVDDRPSALAIHSYALGLAALHGLQIDVFDLAFYASFVLRRLFEAGRTADVERTHRYLRTGLANRLRGDDADGLTN